MCLRMSDSAAASASGKADNSSLAAVTLAVLLPLNYGWWSFLGAFP